MKTTYQINGYQVLHHDGSRDTVKLAQPVVTDCLEQFRKMEQARHGCKSVNLTYTEIVTIDNEGRTKPIV